MATAAHMLSVWRQRRDRLRGRGGGARPEILEFCEEFVRALEALDPATVVAYGMNSTRTGYEAKNVPASVELDRVLAGVCTALRNLP